MCLGIIWPVEKLHDITAMLPSILFPFETFETADGSWIQLLVPMPNSGVSVKLTRDRIFGDDPQYRTNPGHVAAREELEPLLQAVFRNCDTSD